MNSTKLTDRVAFVICTERGTLEKKSVMLAQTLRKCGGRFSDCTVLSYSPREGRVPGRDTLRRLEDAGVEAILAPINTEFTEYGFGNKVVACAHAEQHFPHDRLIFLDSDILVFREPTALWSDTRDAVKVRPVSRKLAGSTGSDENAEYWKKALAWAGIAEPTVIETAVTGESIYGYWNAGVISAPGRSGFFRRWLETFRGLIRDGLVHPYGMTFMDQISLSLVAHRPSFRVDELPEGYNFPINNLIAPDEEVRTHSWNPDPDEIVLAHYHKILDRFPMRDPVSRYAPPDRREQIHRIIRRSGFVGPSSYVRHRLHHRLGWDFIAP